MLNFTHASDMFQALRRALIIDSDLFMFHVPQKPTSLSKGLTPILEKTHLQSVDRSPNPFGDHVLSSWFALR